jgi:aminoglycoside phosphotransferase (APT) family kinase protein
VEAVLARLEPLLGPAAAPPAPLEGGITNRNWRARLGDGEYVVRVCARGVGVLGIDRDCEHEAARRAAELGIGPEVAAWLPDEGVLVTRWLGDGAIGSGELRARAPEIAVMLRTFHDGGPLGATFWVPDLVREQRALLDEVPPVLDRALAAAERTGVVTELAPCHNDLLGANFVRDGEAIRIVDWEYAGMNDRLFDLANLSVNNGFSDADDRALLRAYFGDEAQLAGLRAMRIVSDLREAAWGLVQATRSDLDVDFATYAREHLERLEGWLAAA